MKHNFLVLALTLAISASPVTAERFGAGIDVHSVGGWGQSSDSYTPSNPSPGRGGTYDGDDGYRPRHSVHRAFRFDSILNWLTNQN